MAFRPDFITCTYGAGGSTRQKTLEIVEQVQRALRLPGGLAPDVRGFDGRRAARLPARSHAARDRQHRGAARRSAAGARPQFKAVAGGLSYANELVALIRGEFPQFGVAVAGYPETHREAPSPEADLENLQRKVDAGADVVITQLFYDNDDFWRFRDRCERPGFACRSCRAFCR